MDRIIRTLMIILLLCTQGFAQDDPVSENQPDTAISKTDTLNQEDMENTIPSFGFYLSLGFGPLVGGNQVKLVEDSFTLDPDDYDFSILTLEAGSFFYFTRYLGIEAAASKGFIQVEHPDVNDTLDAYTYWKIDAGLTLRYPYQLEGGSIIAASLSGGMNYCSLKFDDEYRDLTGFRSDSATGIGYYLKLGFDVYTLQFLYVGAGLQYAYHNVQYSGATKALDGHNIIISLRAGIVF